MAAVHAPQVSVIVRSMARASPVRPHDGGLVYNLALLDCAAGELGAARRHARKASQLAPDFVPAHALVTELG